MADRARPIAASEAGGVSSGRPIGAAAAMSGVKVETIRYYERTGIVPRPARTASGRRTYGAEDIMRLRFIGRCRNLGFSIPDTRALLQLAENSEAPSSAVRELAARHLSDVRRKIEQLSRLEQALAELLERCEDGRAGSPMLSDFLLHPDPLSSQD